MNDLLVVRDMSDLIKIRDEYPHLREVKPRFVGQDIQRALRGWIPDKIYVSVWASEHEDWKMVTAKGAVIPYRIQQGSELVCLGS